MTEKRFTLSTTEFDGTLSFYDAECDCETRMGTEYVLNSVETTLNYLNEENEQLKQLIKKVLETTPIEHSLAIDLKNSIRELYE